MIDLPPIVPQTHAPLPQTIYPPTHSPLPEPEPHILYELTARQRLTIDLLLAGQPIVQIAATLGITPRTITRWKNAQPEFIAEYNRRIADHSTVTAARLRRMVDMALTQVETVMASDDTKLKTTSSLRILSTMVSRNLAHQHGPTQCADVIASFLKDRLRSYNEDDKTPLTGDLREPFTFELTQYLIDEAQRELQEQQQAQAAAQPQSSAATPTPESPTPPAPAASTTQAAPAPDSSTTAREPNKVEAASSRFVLASPVNSPTLAPETPSQAPQSDNVRKCPVLSGPTDPDKENDLSTDHHTTCEQKTSCPDQTSAAPEPPTVPQQDQTPESNLHKHAPHASPPVTTECLV